MTLTRDLIDAYLRLHGLHHRVQGVVEHALEAGAGAPPSQRMGWLLTEHLQVASTALTELCDRLRGAAREETPDPRGDLTLLRHLALAAFSDVYRAQLRLGDAANGSLLVRATEMQRAQLDLLRGLDAILRHLFSVLSPADGQVATFGLEDEPVSGVRRVPRFVRAEADRARSA